MNYIFQINDKIKIIISVSLLVFSIEGCSSFYVVAEQASKADDIYNETVFSYLWGLDDNLESVECHGEGLQMVSVKTNWVYSLCTFVTLGAIVPMEVEYRCTSVPLQDGGEIGFLEEVIHE